jgi:hypothetical protein
MARTAPASAAVAIRMSIPQFGSPPAAGGSAPALPFALVAEQETPRGTVALDVTVLRADPPIRLLALDARDRGVTRRGTTTPGGGPTARSAGRPCRARSPW